MRSKPSNRTDRGFSLIELLVVLGIVVALAAGYGATTGGGGSDGIALRSAQAQLASAVTLARSQAVLRQARVRVVIHAVRPPQGENEKYLRCAEIAVGQSTDGGQWLSKEEPINLPRGILFVPPVIPASLLAPGVVWPAGPLAPVSALAGGAGMTLNGQVLGETYWIEYTPDGRVEPVGAQLVVATARVAGNGLPHLNNPAAVRGLRLHASGSVGWMNRTDDF